MSRFFPVTLAAFVVVSPAAGKRAPAPSPVQRAVAAEVVVIGKVTAIEKESVEVAPEPGSPKQAFAVAVIKVESSLAGAANLTHVKVGFPADSGPRGRNAFLALKEGQEGLLFLTKHPAGGFYGFNWMTSPVDAAQPDFKAQVENVKKALAAVADPMKALKADRADDRALAAVALVMKYRTAPQSGEADTEAVPAAESKLILAALAEGDWTKYPADLPHPSIAFYMLGLGPNDGWVPPKPAQPGGDFRADLRTAFATWVAGPGHSALDARTHPVRITSSEPFSPPVRPNR